MSDEPSLESLQKSLDGFLSGASGIRYDLLTHFAEPLFDLYQVDPRASLAEGRENRARQETALLLAVLETARLFWAYLLLDPDTRDERLTDLESRLLGRSATSAERTDFLALISVIEDFWYSVTPANRTGTTVPGHPLPSFDVLLAQYGAPLIEEVDAAGVEHYGPDDLDLPEALALFSRPLLEDVRMLEDPDVLEQTLSRAQAYWDLAQAAPEEYSGKLELIKKAFASSSSEAERVEKEAERMVHRFHHLFPEHRPR